MDHRRNPFAPEPLSFSNFSGDTGDSDEPGTFAFKDLQNIQDISAPTPTVSTRVASMKALHVPPFLFALLVCS